MTTTLAERLRGIIAAKPPHVTVLADNAEVFPIRGAQLIEAADLLEELEGALIDAECERDHAYWNSCGCLAGGSGHQEGGPDCPRRPTVPSNSPHEASD